MTDTPTMVIRGGTIVDGTGGEMFEADVAIAGDRIVEVGRIAGRAKHEIDARGKLVMPGFVDVHTHYDAQVTWANQITPSSCNGVTTVLMGNCGVGFAPVRPDQHDMLISLMEGVEDIPEVVLSEGLPWTWESFPDYLDTLERRRFDVDVATQVPHAALRVYVMGKRGADREPARAEDRARMAKLAADGSVPAPSVSPPRGCCSTAPPPASQSRPMAPPRMNWPRLSTRWPPWDTVGYRWWPISARPRSPSSRCCAGWSIAPACR